jgi:protein tyrosine/serine phosphatase
MASRCRSDHKMRSGIPTRGIRIGVVFGFLVLASAAGSQTKRHNLCDCNPTSMTRREIPNFHKVDNDLYRGGHPTCEGLSKLEALGIRSFIDLGGAQASLRRCKSAAARAGMQFISFKISIPRVVLLGVPDQRLRTLFASIQRARKPIFLSCSLGRDRTGLIAALYRMKRGEMSFPEAEREAIYYGYRPRFIGLRRALERYRDPQELQLLPAPSSAKSTPEGVCRAQGLVTAGSGF